VAQAHSATLSKQLRRTRSRLAVAVKRERQLKAAVRNAESRAAGAGSQAARDEATLAALRHDAAKVTSDVAALQAYVSATPNQSLDGGFLRSQLSYLAAAARRLRSR
jgi:hypothetical protein